MADAVSTYESILTNPAHLPDNTSSSTDNPSSEDTQLFSKPSLSYIALIAKVLLSSPSQKLNLASIYRAMEERFPYLRSRGRSWRNSVRHNLSVNDCFVKVSRCEDGRGHYWGVHKAHLRDFQQGNFRQYRKSRSLGCVEPQCPLQEQRKYQMSSLDWTQPRYQPWSLTAGWVQSPSWMRHYYFPERLPDSYGRAAAGRGHGSQPMTSTLHCWGMKEAYGGRSMTPPVQELRFPGFTAVQIKIMKRVFSPASSSPDSKFKEVARLRPQNPQQCC
uniref:Fork-head domain-containing protein n=1 Tax=Sander lucioperca TaxID=283035 RepID=A0A8C9ZTD7_SANLU